MDFSTPSVTFLDSIAVAFPELEFVYVTVNFSMLTSNGTEHC